MSFLQCNQMSPKIAVFSPGVSLRYYTWWRRDANNDISPGTNLGSCPVWWASHPSVCPLLIDPGALLASVLSVRCSLNQILCSHPSVCPLLFCPGALLVSVCPSVALRLKCSFRIRLSVRCSLILLVLCSDQSCQSVALWTRYSARIRLSVRCSFVQVLFSYPSVCPWLFVLASVFLSVALRLRCSVRIRLSVRCSLVLLVLCSCPSVCPLLFGPCALYSSYDMHDAWWRCDTNALTLGTDLGFMLIYSCSVWWTRNASVRPYFFGCSTCYI